MDVLTVRTRPSNFVNSNFVNLDGFNMLVNYDVHLNESI